MLTSLIFIFRLSLAWFLVYLVAAINVHEMFFREEGGDHGGAYVLPGFALVIAVVVTAFSPLRRVRLIKGEVHAAALSNRQRRQIEVPCEAGEAFDLVEAAIRELPGVQEIDSA